MFTDMLAVVSTLGDLHSQAVNFYTVIGQEAVLGIAALHRLSTLLNSDKREYWFANRNFSILFFYYDPRLMQSFFGI